jgi:hypothetical protein
MRRPVGPVFPEKSLAISEIDDQKLKRVRYKCGGGEKGVAWFPLAKTKPAPQRRWSKAHFQCPPPERLVDSPDSHLGQWLTWPTGS